MAEDRQRRILKVFRKFSYSLGPEVSQRVEEILNENEIEDEDLELAIRNRLHIIKQCVLRNEHFAPSTLPSKDRERLVTLKSTKQLLGRAGERFLLLGMLTHNKEGKLCIEDSDGTVELDFSQLDEPGDGLFTEGSFALVEGEYTDDATLEIVAIGQPPCESREISRSIYGHIDFLGKGSTSLLEDSRLSIRVREELPDLHFFFLSDVWLDHPQTLIGLEKVFQNCDETDFIPKLMVLCGNFTRQSISHGNSREIQTYHDNFEALADLIASYPRIVRETHIVLVPGPLDITVNGTLPRQRLLSSLVTRLQDKVPKIHFASNPCRIKFFDQEIVIFRDDIMSRMLRHVVGVKPNADSDELKRFLVQTILDQGHLSPFTINIQPTLPDYDHTLRLYPLPTVVSPKCFVNFHLLNLGTSLRFNPREGTADNHSLDISLNIGDCSLELDTLRVLLQSLRPKRASSSSQFDNISPVSTSPMASPTAETEGFFNPLSSTLSPKTTASPSSAGFSPRLFPSSPTSPLLEKLSASIRPRRRHLYKPCTRVKDYKKASLLSVLNRASITISSVTLATENKWGLDPYQLKIQKIAWSSNICNKPSSDPFHTHWLGNRKRKETCDPDVYGFKFSIAQAAIERRTRLDSMRLLTLDTVQIQAIVTQWPAPWLTPSTFIVGDPNSPFVAIRAKLGGLDVTERLERLRELVAHLEPSVQKDDPKPPKPSISMPRLAIEAQCGVLRGRIICADANDTAPFAVELRNNGFVFAMESNFIADYKECSRASDCPSDSFRLYYKLSFVLDPTLIKVRSKTMPEMEHFTSLTTNSPDFLHDPSILSLEALEIFGDGHAIASMERDVDLVASVLTYSPIFELHISTEAVCLEMWNPHVIRALQQLCSISPPKDHGEPQLPGVSSKPPLLDRVPPGVWATMTIPRVSVIMTYPDLNPQDTLELARGIVFRTGLTLNYCSMHSTHTYRFHDLNERTTRRSKLCLPEQQLVVAVSAARASVITQNASAHLKIAFSNLAVRSAVSTQYDADNPHLFERDDPTFAKQEFLTIPSVLVNLCLSGKRDGGASKANNICEASVVVPDVKATFHLAYVYSSMLAMQCVKAFLPKSSPRRITQPKPLSTLAVKFKLSISTIQVRIDLRTQHLVARLDDTEVHALPGHSPSTQLGKLVVWICLPHRVNRWEDTSGAKWEEFISLQALHASLPSSPPSLSLQGQSARLRIPHGYVFADFLTDAIVTAKALRHLRHITAQHSYAPMPTPQPESPKHVPRIKISLHSMCIEAADDPFESKLAIILRSGHDASQHRIDRENAFTAKVAAIYQAESQVPPSGSADYLFGGDHSVSIDEARRRLDEVHELDWTLRLRELRLAQAGSEEAINQLLQGKHSKRSAGTKIPNLVDVTPIADVPPLFRVLFNGVSVDIQPISFPLDYLPDFLFEQGSGLPRNTKFSLLVPLHLNFTLTSLHITLRDYPLPLFSVPATSDPTSPAWTFDTDLVVAEEMGSDLSVDWLDCVVLEPHHGVGAAPAFSISVPKTIMPVKTASESWVDGVTPWVGVKGLIDEIHADMHQRDEETKVQGTEKVLRRKPVYAAEVSLKGLDLRALLAIFKEPLRQEIEMVAPPQRSNYRTHTHLPTTPAASVWFDRTDFVEMDWSPLPASEPKLHLLPFATCPQFTYFKKKTVLPRNTTLLSKFGSEAVPQVQIEIAEARMQELRRLIKNKKTGSDSEGRAILEKMVTLLEAYVLRLREMESPSPQPYETTSETFVLPSYTVSSDEWTDFENVYQFHCPRVIMDAATRDVLLQYYYSSRARKGLEYRMATRAVKFIRDQAEAALGDDDIDSDESDEKSWEAADTALMAASALKKIFKGDPVKPSVEFSTGKHRTGGPSETFDALDGWSDGVSLRKSHFCLLLKPQLVMRGENPADSVVVASLQVRLQVFAIMDDNNIDDPVSGKVMSRSHSSVSGLQTFAPATLTSKGSTHVPYEVLIDLRCQSSTFDQLVPQTDAVFHYDKFNRLRLRNNITSSGLFLIASWKVLAPVGGITIYEAFELSLHPIRLQIDARVGRRIMEYLWPARKHRHANDAEESGLIVDKRTSLDSPRALQGPRPPSSPSDQLGPPLRKLGTSRSFTDLRGSKDTLKVATVHKVPSTDSLRKVALAGDGEVSRKNKAKKDDAAEMKTRTSQRSFVLVKIASMNLLLSIVKEGSFECHEARIKTRDLEYRNQTWSFEELVNQFIPSNTSWRGWVKMAFHQPLVPVLPVARELISKTKWIPSSSKTIAQIDGNGPVPKLPRARALSEDDDSKLARAQSMNRRTNSKSPAQGWLKASARRLEPAPHITSLPFSDEPETVGEEPDADTPSRRDHSILERLDYIHHLARYLLVVGPLVLNMPSIRLKGSAYSTLRDTPTPTPKTKPLTTLFIQNAESSASGTNTPNEYTVSPRIRRSMPSLHLHVPPQSQDELDTEPLPFGRPRSGTTNSRISSYIAEISRRQSRALLEGGNEAKSPLLSPYDAVITHEGQQAEVTIASKGETSVTGSVLSFLDDEHSEDSSSQDVHHDDIVDHLDVIDPQIGTVSSLANAANALIIPPNFWYSRKPVVIINDPLPTSAQATAELGGQPEKRLQDSLDRHVDDVLRNPSRIKRTLLGVWSFLKTRTHGRSHCYIWLLRRFINFHNANTQGFWIEVSSQVVNGLFTITGVGLIPFRALDTYRIFWIWHYKRKTRRLRLKAGLPLLYDEDDLPDPKYDSNYVRVLTETEEKFLYRQQRKFRYSQTWYRPHGTITHRAFPIKYVGPALGENFSSIFLHDRSLALIICLLNDANSCFQVILCGTMWGLDRFQRPAWSTGILIPCGFISGIAAAFFIWRGGQKTKRVAEVEERLRAALASSGDPMSPQHVSYPPSIRHRHHLEKMEKLPEHEVLVEEHMTIPGPSSTAIGPPPN
ncbi:hypothetical protein H0H93_000127 [Arthromyces matolae]|nr:hypothetical protein H0H93_000127 [Arthromyces matolae]